MLFVIILSVCIACVGARSRVGHGAAAVIALLGCDDCDCSHELRSGTSDCAADQSNQRAHAPRVGQREVCSTGKLVIELVSCKHIDMRW